MNEQEELRTTDYSYCTCQCALGVCDDCNEYGKCIDCRCPCGWTK